MPLTTDDPGPAHDHLRPELPGRPGGRRRSSTRPWPTPTCSGAVAARRRSPAPFNRAKLAERHDREPRRRVDAGQPGRRGAAVGDRAAGVRRRADRVHEPGRSARRTWSATAPAATRRADLQAGRRRAAVRQHAGQHEADRRADQDGARAAVAARPVRRGRSCGSASPTGFTLHLRPGRSGRLSRITGDVARRRADRPRPTSYSVTVNSFLASGGDNFRELRQRHEQARHRQGRPAGDGRLHGGHRQHGRPDYTQRAVGVHFGDRRAGRVRRRVTRWRSTLSSLAFIDRGRHQGQPRRRSSSAAPRSARSRRQHHRHRHLRRVRQGERVVHAAGRAARR